MTTTPWTIRCTPEFVAEMRRLAIEHNFTDDAMYALWMVYVERCAAGGGGESLGEFGRVQPWKLYRKRN